MSVCPGYPVSLLSRDFPPDYWQRATLGSLLQDRANELGDQVLYTFLSNGNTRSQTLTYSGLDAKARAIAARLRRLAEPGDRALLLFPDGLDCVAGLFGCFYSGIIAVSGVPSSAPASLDRFVNIARDSGAAIILGTSAQLVEVQREAGDRLTGANDGNDPRWVAVDKLREGAEEYQESPFGSNDGLALLQYTSGSTGQPRGVMLTHRNLLHNLQGQMAQFGYRRGDTGVSWLPFAHDMGLIGAVLMALYGAGHCAMFSPLDFVQQPVLWLQTISRLGATVSGGPNFAYELCANRITDDQKEDLDLSRWRIAFNGAEPVRGDTIDHFCRTFEPCGFHPEAIYPCYGLAEASLLVSGGHGSGSSHFSRSELRRGFASYASDRRDSVEVVSCGLPMPGLEVRIADPEDRTELFQKQLGEIWVQGPSIASGYFGRPSDTEQIFEAYLRSGEGPWLRTGDLGFFLDGQLFISGRLKDLIIIRGTNYYPHDLEATAESSHPDVRRGSVIAFPIEYQREERVAVVCELRHGGADLCELPFRAIREAILEQHGLAVHTIASLPPGTTPKTPSGKLQRHACREQFESGALPILQRQTWDSTAQETETDRRAALRQWLATQLERWNVAPDQAIDEIPFAHLGFDSLRIIQLKSELESLFGIRIDVAELIRFRDFAHLESWLLAAFSHQPPVERAAFPEAKDAERTRDGILRLRQQRLQRRS